MSVADYVQEKENLKILLRKEENYLEWLNNKINAFSDIHSEQKKILQRCQAIIKDAKEYEGEAGKELSISFQFRSLEHILVNSENVLFHVNRALDERKYFKKCLIDEIRMVKAKIAGYAGKIKTTITKKSNDIAYRYRATVVVLQKLKVASSMQIYSLLPSDLVEELPYKTFTYWLHQKVKKGDKLIVCDFQNKGDSGKTPTTYKLIIE